MSTPTVSDDPPRSQVSTRRWTVVSWAFVRGRTIVVTVPDSANALCRRPSGVNPPAQSVAAPSATAPLAFELRRPSTSAVPNPSTTAALASVPTKRRRRCRRARHRTSSADGRPGRDRSCACIAELSWASDMHGRTRCGRGGVPDQCSCAAAWHCFAPWQDCSAASDFVIEDGTPFAAMLLRS